MGYTQFMQALSLFVVGSVQEGWQAEAISQYLTRLRPFARVQIVEIPDERESATVPAARLQAREAEMLRRRLPKDVVLVVLDEMGQQLTSPQWAKLLETEAGRGAPIAFVMGGANGIDPSLRAEADYVLALGKQTMPHVLARIVLLEQLYRAQTILQGKTYHR